MRSHQPTLPVPCCLPPALLACALFVFPACKSTPATPEPTRVRVEATAGVTDPGEMLSEVRDFASRFQTTVAGMGSLFAAQTKDLVVRERTLQWRIQSIPAMHAASDDPDPRVALANVWAMCARQRYLFENDPEHPLMGDQNEAAVKVAHELEDAIIEIARKHITPEKTELAKEKIEQVARRENTALLFKTPLSAPNAKESTNPITQLLGLPLAPLKGMQGIGDTPAELHRLNELGQHYAQLVQELPDILRWQAELLALSIDQLPTLKSVQDISRTVGELRASADALPEKVGSELRATLGDVSTTLADTRAAAEAVTASAQSATAFANAWKSAFPVSEAPAPDASQPAAKPFEMGDVTRAAQQLSVTVGETRDLLAELQTALKSGTVPALEQSAQSVMKQASEHADDVVDRAFWRALVLIGVLFALLACLRLIRRGTR